MLEVELLERDRWSRDDLLAYQGERVRKLVRHAVAQSPYYREALGTEQTGRFQSCPPCRRRR
jgi:phenylacetate-coenzyme A ligase PaaK-like adenylate-forming protein